MTIRHEIDKGATSQSIWLRALDADGQPVTSIAYNSSGIDIWYMRDGAASVDVTEVTLAAPSTAWATGGFVHINDGYVRLCIPDLALATGVNKVLVGGTATGVVFEGAAIDLMDPVTITTGGVKVNDFAAGALTATAIASDAITAAKVASDVTTELQTGLATASALSTVSGKIDTVDDFLDTEIAAILAAVDTEVAAIKTKTDFLPSATAGAAGGLFIAGSNAATSVTTALTANVIGNVTGNVSGSVGSVTGAVGSVTGAVGSVTGAVASVTAAVATTSNIKKNQALPSFMFVMRDSTNHAPVTGKTVSVFISKDGGSFNATTTATATEVANGWYKISFTQTEMNANVVAVRATATTSDDFTMTILTAP